MKFANIKDLTDGQIVYLDGGFTCHLPGPTKLCCDSGGLHFLCYDGRHYLDGQKEEDGTVTGVSDLPFFCTWEQAGACKAIP